jgi:GTP-binding protein Era
MNMNSTEEHTFLSGFVAVVGMANVGKSTLVNALTESKTSITSPKPQTTRHRIMGIKNSPSYQIVYVDTPGVKKAKDELDKAMEKIYRNEARDADLILFLVDALVPPGKKGPETEEILTKLRGFKRPLFLVINKIDQAKEEQVEEHRNAYGPAENFAAVFAISALKRERLKKLEAAIVKRLEPGPAYFPSTMQTDQSPESIAAEVFREKILETTHQEIPHGVFVYPEEIRDGGKEGDLFIRLVIYVEKESHKGMIIGKGGKKLKEIGTLARKELAALWGKEVYLETHVKVKEKWKDRKDLLRSWGYEV